MPLLIQQIRDFGETSIGSEGNLTCCYYMLSLCDYMHIYYDYPLIYNTAHLVCIVIVLSEYALRKRQHFIQRYDQPLTPLFSIYPLKKTLAECLLLYQLLNAQDGSFWVAARTHQASTPSSGSISQQVYLNINGFTECTVILLFLSLYLYMSSLFLFMPTMKAYQSFSVSTQCVLFFFFKSTALISMCALFEILGLSALRINHVKLLRHRLINLSSENIANNSNFIFFLLLKDVFWTMLRKTPHLSEKRMILTWGWLFCVEVITY